MLTNIVTYHVVPGRVRPDQVVVCGGVSTANATVYMIDTVLMPPPAA